MINIISGFGIDVDFKDRSLEEIDKIIYYLEKLEVRWVRLNLDINRADDVNYLELIKSAIDKLINKNIVILGLVTEYVPANFTNIFFSNFKFKAVNNNMIKILSAVKTFALKLKISHWEIWNEQNMHRFWHQTPDPAQYVNLVSKSFEIIKSINPGSNIIFGGINGNDIEPVFLNIKPFSYYRDFLKLSIKLGVSKFVNSIAFHPYHSACYFSFNDKNWFRTKIKNSIEKLVKKYPTKKFVISEFGINPSFNFKLTNKDISEIYKDLLDYANSLDIPFCLYNLIDDPDSNYSRLKLDNNFGFLDNNLNEKEIYKNFVA